MATKKTKKKGGRPQVITPEILEQLKWCFAQDMNTVQALTYCQLDQNTFYRYVKVHPEDYEFWKALRNKPALNAKICVATKLEVGDDPEFCLEYLKLKDPDFKQKTHLQIDEVPQIVDDVK